MNYFSLSITISWLYWVNAKEECKVDCPRGGPMVCGFSPENTVYKMFPSVCAMIGYSKCNNVVFNETSLDFCVKAHNKLLQGRRSYGESCPVFCPNYYSPVCGASKYRSYMYRTFNNGCYLDMINCRGVDEDLGYVEVPLSYCQNHPMKNIFKEQLIFSGLRDYRDYE